MKKRKVKNVTMHIDVANMQGNSVVVCATCNDGTVWLRTADLEELGDNWAKLGEIPQPQPDMKPVPRLDKPTIELHRPLHVHSAIAANHLNWVDIDLSTLVLQGQLIRLYVANDDTIEPLLLRVKLIKRSGPDETHGRPFNTVYVDVINSFDNLNTTKDNL